MYLNKVLYPLLSTGSIQDLDVPNMTEKTLLTGRKALNKTNLICKKTN